MRRRSIALLLSVLSAVLAAEGPAIASAPGKIDNARSRPLAADEGMFLAAAQRAPAKGACEVLSPDPGFVEEMLVRFGEGGAKSYERRVALIVGNGAYRAITPLKNPPNDAASMAKMFRALGFTVYRAVDATEVALADCFAKFKGHLEASDTAGAKTDIALFFYAGHGVQLTSQADNEKRNYMLSVDAKVDASGKAKGFRQVDAVLNEMRAHSKQAIFLYDACRNAPYGEGAVKEADGAAVRMFDVEGAAPIVAGESETASQAGLFIAYATSPGKTADDAWGTEGSTHSPFTEALLKNLPVSGEGIEEALVDAYFDVRELTSGRQTPWTSSSLTERVRLNGAVEGAELAVRVARLTGDAARLRADGLRGAAISAALKAQPRRWFASAAHATQFAHSRAELFRSYERGDLKLAGHAHMLTSASFSPDGGQIATTSLDNSAIFWSASLGVPVRRIWLDRGVAFMNAEYTPDGTRIVTGASDGIVRILDSRDGRVLTSLGASGEGGVARISASGAVIAAAYQSGRVVLWDAARGVLLRTIETGHALINVAVDATGGKVASTHMNGSIRIWNAASGDLLRSIDAHRGMVAFASFSHDGVRLVSAGEDQTAKVWAVGSGELLLEMRGHEAEVSAAAFSPSGRYILTASFDAKAILWDANTGARLQTYVGPSNAIITAEFDRSERRILAASADRSARVWPIEEPSFKLSFLHDGKRVTSATFSRDDALVLTASYDDKARLWNARTGKLVRAFVGADDLNDAAFSSDASLIVAASSNNVATVWDVRSGAKQARLTGHAGAVLSAKFSPDDEKIVTGSADGVAKIWNAGNGSLLRTLPSHRGEVWAAAFDSTGSMVVTASEDATVKVWRAADGVSLLDIQEFAPATSAVFNRAGTGILASGEDYMAKYRTLWDGQIRTRFEGHTDWVKSANFNPDESRIVTGADDGSLKIWDAFSGLELRSVSAHSDVIYSAEFNSAGDRIVTASYDGAAKIWDAGLYGPVLLEAAYALLTDDLRAEVERERVRYWEVDPEMLK